MADPPARSNAPPHRQPNPRSDAGARQAEALGARLPPLLVAADRVASTVAQGVHGRRRVGQGDSFWQFRRFVTGDPLSRIDWRQSAKAGRPAPDGWFIRETEWEAAQTVCLWRNRSASMNWRSRFARVEKRERAELLLLALASLLVRGGERAMLMRHGARPAWGRSAMDRLAADLQSDREPEAGLPPVMPLPRHGAAVLFSDFLGPLDATRDLLARLAAVPMTGMLMQILDPAEADLPYEGRIRFQGLQSEGDALIPRVASVRVAYAARLAAHQATLADLCTAAGFSFAVHRTDHPPETALLTLYTALGAR